MCVRYNPTLSYSVKIASSYVAPEAHGCLERGCVQTGAERSSPCSSLTPDARLGQARFCVVRDADASACLRQNRRGREPARAADRA